jgi:hypothetical protein
MRWCSLYSPCWLSPSPATKEADVDAVHEAYAKCSRALVKLPVEEQRRVVKALAIMLEILPYDQTGAK